MSAAVVWSGLALAATAGMRSKQQRADLMRSVRLWVGALEDRGLSSEWRLRLALEEPISIGNAATGDEEWSLILQLQSIERPTLVVEAEDIWALRADSATIEGLRIDDPKTLLLSELARAARLFEPLSQALAEDEPFRVSLDTKQAYMFLRAPPSALIAIMIPKIQAIATKPWVDWEA